MTSDHDIEQEIQRLGLTAAPRLTFADIEATIDHATYYRVEGKPMVVCCLHLRNGFTVTGENAAVSLENYSEKLGEQYAFEKARDKIWELEGYLLKEKLYRQALQKELQAQANL
jgi:hypothetical protein